MEKSKKFRMPSGIRNKLMAAIAMLLVSSIMMVSSTYAWFTLSTAPEVTGITTSVGANGNLEMALLTTETYDNMDSIQSNVGNSSAIQAVNLANVTWGNLVDLSASVYGLTDIVLMPAALAYNAGSTTNINVVSPLRIAEYGADGRVTTANGPTVSAVAANGAFATGDTQTYGVRAIGTASNLSAREIALRNAKSIVSTTKNAAKTASRTAIYNNMNVLLAYAFAVQGGRAAPTSYTQDDLTAFVAIANGVISDLATLENGYRNAAIAYVAKNSADDAEFAAAKTAIETLPLEQLAADDYGLGSLATAMGTLAEAQTNAAAAKETLTTAAGLAGGVTDGDGESIVATNPSATQVNAAIKLLVDKTDASATTIPANVYIKGGAIGELGNQVGTFELASVGSMGTVYAGDSVSTVATFDTVALAVSGLTIENGGNTVSNITDTYGYIIDFAFRTNAAESYLQLQTAAVNRVYSGAEGANLATQGGGSNVTYTYTSGMTQEQVEALLGAIRLVFLSTADGTVYATAGLTDITMNDTEATANVKLTGLAEDADKDNIVALDQNVAKAVSVLVYLDGEQVDNADVANAASSGTLNLNLQFSSSAALIPMKNTALEQMTQDQVTVVQPVTTYTVTVPTGVTGAATVAEGANYSFTVADGYTLGTVTMGGVEVAPTLTEGTYSIADVTGAIVINVTAPAAPAPETYAVTINGAPAEDATAGQDYAFTVDVALTNVTATVDGDSVTVNGADGSYTIAAENVTGDIVITATAPADPEGGEQT